MFCYNLERLIKVKTFFDFMKLHIGCGRDKRKGYVNCDISPEVYLDKIVDIEKNVRFNQKNRINIFRCIQFRIFLKNQDILP